MTSNSPIIPSTVENRGIYCGLPKFSPLITGRKAIVFGANGISGNYMLRALSQTPERWEHVAALSRRPHTASQGIGKNVEHIQVDLLQEPEEIAKILRHHELQPDVVFFFAYIQPPPADDNLWSNAEELTRSQGKLLQNCLDALQLASIRPKRFLLQTGAKYYGVHLGPVHSPAVESDPRVLIEPNFYYVQEDMLSQYCRQNGVQWNVVRPAVILGAVEGSAMNSVYALAVYAAVQKHKGEKLVWPGDAWGWEKEVTHSSAMLNSYLSEYVVLNEHAGNEAFNASDGSPFTYGRLWAQLAKWHGLEFTYPDDDSTGLHELTLQHKPPRGFGKPPTIRFNFTFFEWAQRPENQQAWKELTQKHNLIGNPFGPNELEKTFEYLDFAVLPPHAFTMNLAKGRKFGWYGFVDTIESHRQVIEELVALNMVPPL
ncbi:NAD dependent epimerase/dehydratase family protein [Cadophora sp. MPI-SDFR-AT-0126]|nr:NAD dependent epimerase/dehydratase family protein [Leotiomycetes sp. MPI-SDFR-AT-0126]